MRRRYLTRSRPWSGNFLENSWLLLVCGGSPQSVRVWFLGRCAAGPARSFPGAFQPNPGPAARHWAGIRQHNWPVALACPLACGGPPLAPSRKLPASGGQPRRVGPPAAGNWAAPPAATCDPARRRPFVRPCALSTLTTAPESQLWQGWGSVRPCTHTTPVAAMECQMWQGWGSVRPCTLSTSVAAVE